MGVQIGLRGQGNYAATVDSVRQQPADRASAPDYQALRDYVFAGAGAGTLRVKYGNHNRQLELGTKGMFARGERHELTTAVLEQAVARQYGARAASQFVAAVRVSTTKGDVYKLDKATVRQALSEVEDAFGDRAAALKHPEVLQLPPDSGDVLAADIKANWVAGGPIPAEPAEPAGSEPLELFPAQCRIDINRSQARLENGELLIRSGGARDIDDRDQYVRDETEKYIAFFEQGSGVQRDAPEFKNMFRNFIRNLQQNFELTLNDKVMHHALRVGYQAHTFVPDGNGGDTVQKLKFDSGQLVFDRSHAMPVSLVEENLELMATMTENFRLPVEALKTKESEFDISKVAVNPTRSYVMAQIS